MNLPIARHTQSFRDTSSGGPMVDITSNYLLYAPSTGHQDFKDFLAYTHLPKAPLTGPENLQLVKYPLNIRDDEKIAAFQLDESQGLLAVIISSMSSPTAALYFLIFPHFNFHPLTAAQAGISLQFEDTDKCQIQIYGDNVGVLLCGSATSLTVYNWKTGRTKVRYAPMCRLSITAFCFLPANTIVTTNLPTRQIDLWEMNTRSKTLDFTVSLGLPAVRPGIKLESFVCTALSPGQFSNSQISPVITFSLYMCKNTADGATSYCVVKIVTYLRDLFDLGFSRVHPTRHIPWEKWGRTAARCFDDSYSIDGCDQGGQYFVSLTDVDGPKPNELSVYDFGRSMVLEDVQPQRLEPRINCQELAHLPVFSEDVYTLRSCSILRCLSLGPSDKILVDNERIFRFKHRHRFSLVMYSF